uniref:Uncharacterized protein n=1 Tax=Sphaerodactylus townsendi TaxID=933632 RepID=A0ACB8G7E4_9SAUR
MHQLTPSLLDCVTGTCQIPSHFLLMFRLLLWLASSEDLNIRLPCCRGLGQVRGQVLHLKLLQSLMCPNEMPQHDHERNNLPDDWKFNGITGILLLLQGQPRLKGQAKGPALCAIYSAFPP